MDAQNDDHDGDDPVAHDIESRNPDSGDIVAGEQVLDEGHIAPDQDAERAEDEQQFTETNDPEVTRFDVGAGGVVQSREDTDLAVDREAASVPTNTPDGGLGSGDGGPIEGAPEGEPESTEERRDGADERTDPAAPPAQEPPG
ncbi:hypothetical protein GCM10009792_23100 [Microcella alkalica]|uniref:Uncharacterized protein n=1 Tax=Microcella alkalica TaxID=355930 RepID=A0A839E6E7_9MICO|nr:hypothetical protein [Microcella alkalica]MBA8846886.1 hypothetical protein [Microcella alkalica]